MGNENKMEKRYGLLTAICMVVGIVIGSGVFFKAQTILQATGGDMKVGVAAWIIGGLIMLACILAFAIMATMYEKVNGVVDYAEALVGEKYAYIIGWFMAVIYFPSMTGVLAWLTARYTLVFITSVNPAIAMTEGGPVTGSEAMVLALFFLCGAYAINALSPKLAGKFQVTTTFAKLIPLGLMMVVGVIYGLMNGQLAENFSGEALAAVTETGSASGNALFAAIVSTAFAYEGWVIATSINSELKNAKRNLPIALVSGGLIIMAVYIFYFIGVAGGATTQQLMDEGATSAFLNIFGNVFGNILNLFIAVSCAGTLNGLMLATTRGLFSLAARGKGPKPEMFSVVDPATKMAGNSSIFGLLFAAIWLVHFYGSNLAPNNWFGIFGFDSSELPIITTYLLYLPIFFMFMKKHPELGFVKRFLIPGLAMIGSAFMVFAAAYSHGYKPFLAAQANGTFSCPVLFYLVLFAAATILGIMLDASRKK